MVESIMTVLMKRDGMTEEEARQEVEDAREELQELIEAGECPYDFCQDRFGLEPDYLDELLFEAVL